MTISYYGLSANPADNSTLDSSALPAAVTPPASMVAGDFVFVHVMQRSIHTLSVSATGGQSWTKEADYNIGTTATAAKFWCQFNGTWTANPSWTSTGSGTQGFSVVMVVFRPSDSATWAIDVAQSTGNYTTPGAPATVTATGHDPVDATSTVTLASWYYASATPTFSGLTGGWSYPGSQAQWRNNGKNLSVSLAYLFKTDGSATGNVSNTGTSNGTFQYNWTVQTFKDQSVSTLQFFQYGTQHQFHARR